MWSIIMKPGKKYVTIVDYTFNLSMALLDLETVKNKDDIHTVYIETEDTPRIILCHLSLALNIVQVKLDLVFPRGTTLKLFTSGSAQIHMTGYLYYDEVNTELNSNLENKNLKEENEKSIITNISEIEKVTITNISEINEVTFTNISEIEKATVTNISSIEEENNRKHEDNVPEQLAIETGSKHEVEDNDSKKTKYFKLNESNHQSDENSNEDDNVTMYNENKDYEKVEDKPVLITIEKTQMSPESSIKTNESLSTSSEVRTFNQKDKQNQLKELYFGIKIQDIQVGDGALVESGKKIFIYYIGRIKSTGKVFDLMQEGLGLSFIFQHGEVIKGWDIGIAGMKVGGKRRIVCPPKMNESTGGMKPAVLPRGTLEFEVELLDIENNQDNEEEYQKILKNQSNVFLAQKTSNSNQFLPNHSTKNKPKTRMTRLKTNIQKIKQNQQIELSGGVKIQELQVGNGVLVEPGKRIVIHYIGRIKSTGKVFNAVQTSPGFSFVFQRGEVIKGWDIGIAGMKVGGKRIIVCPNKMNQTNEGMKLPVLPKGTLEFEVKLLYVD